MRPKDNRPLAQAGEQSLGFRLQRLVGAAHALRQPGETGRVEALGGQRRRQLAQADAGEFRIAVGGVLDWFEVAVAAEIHERLFGNIEQRAKQCEMVERRHARHARQPSNSRAARHAEKHGLGLVVR